MVRSLNLLLILGLASLTTSFTPRLDGAAPPVSDAIPRVLTLLDYFESGRRAVDEFVVAPPRGTPALSAVIERAKRACVRVEIRSNEVHDRYQSSSASGVLIDGGRRVLTAGHAVQTEVSSIVVTMLNGESREARLVDSRYDVYGGADRDWALLEIVGPPVISHPSAALADAHATDLTIVLGYPDRIGLDESGRIRFDSGPEGRYLEPLTTLGEVKARSPLRLAPVAGAVPTSGMSGAPVFDTRGRVVGIFVSLGKATSATTVAYTYNAASVGVLRAEAAR